MNEDTSSTAPKGRAPPPDLFGGGFIAAVGALALVIALGYDFGTPRRMGAGFFPIILSGLLILFGAAVAFVRPTSGEIAGPQRMRPILCILGAILCFGLLVTPAGLVPAIMLSVPIAALAERGRRPVPTLILAVCIAALVAAVFVYGLNVPIDLFW